MSQLLLVGDKGLEFPHLGLVARLGDEEFEVAVGRVFFIEVVESALPVSFFVELWIVGESVLHSAEDDGAGLYVAVGFGNDHAVKAAWGL